MSGATKKRKLQLLEMLLCAVHGCILTSSGITAERLAVRANVKMVEVTLGAKNTKICVVLGFWEVQIA